MAITSVVGMLTGATVVGLVGSINEGANLGRALIEIMANPTIDFVPIYCDSFKQKRDVDVSTNMIISQSSGDKQYVTDNAAPRPREWSMQGYIKSLVPFVENFVVFKPSITLQIFKLDEAALSRKLVKFKTTKGEIVDVLVKSMEIIEDPKNQSHAKVNAVVQEVPHLEAKEGTLEGLADSASASLPGDALLTSLSTASVVAGAVTLMGLLA